MIRSMLASRRAASFTARCAGALVVASLSGACSSAVETEATDETVGTADEALSASACAADQEYAVVRIVRSPSPSDVWCAPIVGKNGTWVAQEQMLECPMLNEKDTRTGEVCKYRWRPSCARPSRPDVRVLVAIPNTYVGPLPHPGDACATSHALAYDALERAAGLWCVDEGNSPATCDVCGDWYAPGIKKRDLILPEQRKIQMIEARLTNGTTQIVSVPPPPPLTKLGATTRTGLPPLPAGVAYVDGPVRGYGYPTQDPEP